MPTQTPPCAPVVTEDLQDRADEAAAAHVRLLRRLALLADHDGRDAHRLAEQRGDVAGLSVDDIVLVNGQGRWRYGIVTEVKRTRAVVAFVTASGITSAQRTFQRQSADLRKPDVALTSATGRHDSYLSDLNRRAAMVQQGLNAFVDSMVSAERTRAEQRAAQYGRPMSDDFDEQEARARYTAAFAVAQSWLAQQRRAKITPTVVFEDAYVSTWCQHVAVRDLGQHRFVALAPLKKLPRSLDQLYRVTWIEV